jgi:putative redox protein
MKARATWTGKMNFLGTCETNTLQMDAKPPFGNSQGFTPKELLAISVAGCTAMDVVALMKKYKQTVDSFDVLVDGSNVEKTQPPIFKELNLEFIFRGALDKEKVIEAVKLSQTKFCAVSAMVSPTVPIHYKILVNDEMIATGDAHFIKQQ